MTRLSPQLNKKRTLYFIITNPFVYVDTAKQDARRYWTTCTKGMTQIYGNTRTMTKHFCLKILEAG